jgi:hypothetical protein
MPTGFGVAVYVNCAHGVLAGVCVHNLRYDCYEGMIRLSREIKRVALKSQSQQTHNSAVATVATVNVP